MIKFGLSGTNWTGKTTTLKRLLGDAPPASVQILSLSPIVGACPDPIGREQTLEASQWVINTLKQREAAISPQVTKVWYDRTPLDILAYTLYAFDIRPSEASRALLEKLQTQLI